MTIREWKKDWGEITSKLLQTGKDVAALDCVRKLVEYCEDRKSCEGCAIKKYCGKEEKRDA